MKKILSTLVLVFVFVLVGNAQCIKLFKNDLLYRVYDQQDNYELTFEEHTPGDGETQGNGKITVYKNGTPQESFIDNDDNAYKVTTADGIAMGAMANHNGVQIFVECVQLWEGSPKWATYNVGATNELQTGNHFYYGRATPCETQQASDGTLTNMNRDTQIIGTQYDIAKQNWGDNWVMPSASQLRDLMSRTDTSYVDNYKNTGLKGYLFRGRGDYRNYSIFLPITGIYDSYSGLKSLKEVFYFSGSPADNYNTNCCPVMMVFNTEPNCPVLKDQYSPYCGSPVRAIMKEEEQQQPSE